ncbi:hypothetical protein ACPCIR_16785 [Mycobacterium sp. NPDC051198]
MVNQPDYTPDQDPRFAAKIAAARAHLDRQSSRDDKTRPTGTTAPATTSYDNTPCSRCDRRIRLGPDARKGENPRWCGNCNFELAEFRRLQNHDRALGRPVRQHMPPPGPR